MGRSHGGRRPRGGGPRRPGVRPPARRRTGRRAGGPADLRSVNMARYVLGRRDAPVERAVVDALGAAVEAMDEQHLQAGGCGHAAHPYTGSLEEWDTDADALLGAPDVQVPLAAWDGSEACPRNAAGWARWSARRPRPAGACAFPGPSRSRRTPVAPRPEGAGRGRGSARPGRRARTAPVDGCRAPRLRRTPGSCGPGDFRRRYRRTCRRGPTVPEFAQEEFTRSRPI